MQAPDSACEGRVRGTRADQGVPPTDSAAFQLLGLFKWHWAKAPAPLGSLQRFLALTERIAVQAGDNFAGERHGDDFSARRIGMNEIGGHEARLGCVPARHGRSEEHTSELQSPC